MSAHERPKDLPDFANPPISEEVFGVQFSLEKPLGTPHLGLFWNHIREDFPRFEDQAPLPPQREDLSSLPFRSPSEVHFIGKPPVPRCWFIDASGNRIIQVQADRFLHNWREEKEEPYPRYEAIRDQFLKRWLYFSNFLFEQGLGRPKVNQCELTYVNHIPKGNLWSELGEVGRVFSLLKAHGSTGFLPLCESVSCSMSYAVPDQKGRLYVILGPAIRTKDKAIILQLTLSVKGPFKGESEEDIIPWFQVAREWIVKGFEDLTSPAAWECWGKLNR